MIEVVVRIRPAVKIELASGMFGAWRPYQMRGPLDIGGDIFESGVLEFLKYRLPVAFLEAEVLDLRAKNVFGLVVHAVALSQRIEVTPRG